MTAEEERRVNARIDAMLKEHESRLKEQAVDHALVADMKADLYGEPGANGGSDKPGIKANQRSLLQSRWMMRIGLSMIWAVLLLTAGALLKTWFGG